ncbi:hypothetical protein PG984_008974 [Apiospora sp. TS-2023a]
MPAGSLVGPSAHLPTNLLPTRAGSPESNMVITAWLLCLTTLAVVSQGARIRVDVGSNGAPAFVYTPKVISAQVGDIVDFHFVDENAASSVVRGVAGAPCTPFTPTKKGFFNSGFVLGDPTGSNVFSVKINETTPIPIYCSVGGHCRAGMVGYINPGQGDFEAYASAAAKLTQNQPPPMVPQAGGVYQQGVDGGYIMITFVNGPPGAGGGGGGGGGSGGSAGGSDPLGSAADALLGNTGGSKGVKGSKGSK